MEGLAIKIAETLDISVQGAIDMYPVIRDQYIWYEALTRVSFWAVILAFVLIIAIGITLVIRDETTKFDWNTEEITGEWANVDKVLKIELSALVLFFAIAITAGVVIPFLAPDVMLIKNFLG